MPRKVLHMKRNVYLCQVNNQYGINVFLPYSVGLLQAYCQTNEVINANFDFKDFLYLRQDVDMFSESLNNPKVVGISCYQWNWEHSKGLARSIKARHPDCLIVMGGPQVPLRSEGFFIEHPWVDLLVHYEGETAFSEILLESLKESPDYTSIEGLSAKVGETETHKTPPRQRLVNLGQIPSPYTTGIFDHLLPLFS